jgi:hypothetical protein
VPKPAILFHRPGKNCREGAGAAAAGCGKTQERQSFADRRRVARALHRIAARRIAMFGSIGIGVALSALSTVSALVESAASEIGKAVNSASVSGASQSFSPSESAAPSAAQGVPFEHGVVIPKFDEHTQSALLALQEMHRGG